MLDKLGASVVEKFELQFTDALSVLGHGEEDAEVAYSAVAVQRKGALGHRSFVGQATSCRAGIRSFPVIFFDDQDVVQNCPAMTAFKFGAVFLV
jgi:hypothetical protein